MSPLAQASGDKHCEPCRLGIGGHNDHSMRLQSLDLSRASLRVSICPAYAGHDGQMSPRRLRLALGVLERRQELTGRIRMRAIAEDDVEQKDRCRWALGFPEKPFATHAAVDHGMRAPDGEDVVAEVNHTMPFAPSPHPCSHALQFGLQQTARLIRQRAAGIDAADKSLAGSHRMRGVLDEPPDLIFW